MQSLNKKIIKKEERIFLVKAEGAVIATSGW
jgi:hypothetical protein